MSIPDCVSDLKKTGKISKAFGDRMLDLYGEQFRRQRGRMGHEAAEAEASEATLRIMEEDRALRERQAGLTIKRQREAIDDLSTYDDGKPGAIGKAAIALLDHDGKAKYANVATLKKVILGQAHNLMQSVLDRFPRDLLGRMPEKAEMADVIRELFGQDTGNASAKELAASWSETAEWLRRRFNAAGGAIGKLERWGLPQSHDGVKLAQAGKQSWIETIQPLLDRDRMLDRDGRPFDDQGLTQALSDVFDTISTEGWAKREPSSVSGGAKLANSRSEHRFLVFKDADGWMAYREQFGAGGTAFDAMVAHVEAMATEIAQMERLGPNPTATVRLLANTILKQAGETGARDGWFGSAKGYAKGLTKLHALQSGELGIPVNSKWARTAAGTRSWMVASKLGAAVWSAVSDTAFHAQTNYVNGIPVWKAITGHLQLMASGEHRAAAVRMGLIAEEASSMAAGLQRYTGESMVPGLAARLADGVMRASGLTAWTQTGKWAFGMGQLGHLTDNAHLGFDGLDARTRASLDRYGIDGAAWDAIRTSPQLDVKGATFIDPTAIADRNASERMMRMILTETAYAVPEVTDRARAMTTWGEPGTLAGEAGRSFIQFKSFGVSMILTHGRRAASMGPTGGMAYAGSMFVTTMLMGALTLQAKELQKGRSPRPMEDWTFWRDAALQAGGFGIFGDFLQSTVIQQLAQGSGTARARGLGEAIAGPSLALIEDAVKLGVAPIKDLNAIRQGKQAHYTSREVIRDLKGYTPGGSLWYARLAFEREILDTLQRWIDPNAAQSHAMMEQHAAAKGQNFWWHPGELTPEGAPNMNTALTAPPADQ